jgi:hypothetical protein
LLRIDPTYDINNLGCLKLSHWPKIKHKGEKVNVSRRKKEENKEEETQMYVYMCFNLAKQLF